MLFLKSTQFKKKFKKSPEKIREKVKDRLIVLSANCWDPILNNHPLHGEYSGCKSIDITGDIRLIYKELDKDVCLLLRFGTHHELYGN